MTLTMIKESAVLSSITVPELTYQGLVIQATPSRRSRSSPR